MPSVVIDSTPIKNAWGQSYRPRTGYREWVRNERPYYNKVGPFTSSLLVKACGSMQDRWFYARFPDSDIGLEWVQPDGIFGPNLAPSDSLFDYTTRQKAIFDLQGQLQNLDFNLSVSGAESLKTVEMITHAAARLLQAARALKKGKLGSAYRVLGLSPGSERLPKPKKVRQNAASIWLEINYGWKPLLSDIHGGLQSLATALNQPDVETFECEGKASSSSFSTQRFVNGSSDWKTDFTWDILTKSASKVGVHYRIANGNIVQAARLGLTNPALVAWEVVPFSFVVDWFVPVGNFLTQLSAYHGLEFVSGYQTEIVRKTAMWGGSNAAPHGSVTRGSTTARLVHMRRKKLSSFPYAGLIVKDPFSVSHAITSVALLQSVLGGFSKRG